MSSPNVVYKLEFEVVTDPAMGYFYKKNKLKPHEVDEKYWHKVSKVDTNPWQQFNQLREWEASGEELIRNVHLYEAENVEPSWKEIRQPAGGPR